jgi:hypothetical protein
MNVAEVVSALYDADGQRDRSQQTEAGLSEIGGCSRRLAHRLAGDAETNDTEKMRALMGAILHDAAETAIKRRNPFVLTELEVEWCGVKGHLDLYDDADKSVSDLKFPSLKSSNYQRDNGVDRGYRWQVHSYAAGMIEAGYEVDTVRIIFLPVDGKASDAWEWVEPFDPETAAMAGAHVLHTAANLESGDYPAPEKPKSYCALYCPFFGACPGGEVRAKAAPPLPDEVVPAAALYIAARDAKKAAEDQMAFARSALEGYSGVGGGYSVGWKIPKDEQPMTLDLDAVRADYANSGVPMPMKPKSASATIDVREVV